MPDLIRHPVSFWIPAFAGMTTVGYLPAGLIASQLPIFYKRLIPEPSGLRDHIHISAP